VKTFETLYSTSTGTQYCSDWFESSSGGWSLSSKLSLLVVFPRGDSYVNELHFKTSFRRLLRPQHSIGDDELPTS